MKLSPEWLALEEGWGSRPKIRGALEDLRSGYEQLSELVRIKELEPWAQSVNVRDEVIKGGLRVRIYTPEIVQQGQQAPLGVYAHGGGYTVGGLNTSFEDHLCRYISHHAPCILVAVGYRRAPEYPVPSQLYDYLGGYNWSWANAKTLGSSQDNVFAIGASCGGGLAIAVALKYLEYGLPGRVQGVVALAPMTIHPDFVPEKYRPYLRSWEENCDGPVVDFEGMLVFQDLNGATAMKRSPDVFPALHVRLAELPPTYIATCGADVIRDDGTIIKHELDKFGVPYQLDNYEALPHFFWIYPEIPEGVEFRQRTAAAVNWVLGQRKRAPGVH